MNASFLLNFNYVRYNIILMPPLVRIIWSATLTTSYVVAVLVITPRDTEVKVNDSTYLNCSTSLATSVQWHHGKLYVYTGSDILEPYNERFAIERNSSTGAYNLVIQSVQPQDAGEYQCQDDEGFGESRSAQLIVLDNDPVCTSNIQPDGVVGPNSCGVETEKVELSCSVQYHGNTPVVEWIKSGSNHSITEGVAKSTSSNNLNSTLTIDATVESNLNGSSFICQTKRVSWKQYICTSKVVKVIYVFSGNTTVRITLGKEINCFANSSQSCTYKWIWFSEEDTVTISENSTLSPTMVGQHRCEAACVLRNTPCTVTVMFAEAYPSAPNADCAKLELFSLLFLPVALILILILWRDKLKRTAILVSTKASTLMEPLNRSSI